MSFVETDTTVDGFLGGKIQICQPRDGYRAATDPVFLAASVMAKSGDRVLELGCGVGVASLCLAARITGVSVVGIEVQPDYAALARHNAMQNQLDVQVFDGNLMAMPHALRALSFDHVIANPPFFAAGAVSPPRDTGKTLAHLSADGMGVWIDAGVRRLKVGGTITIIQLAEHLPEILAGLDDRVGDIWVLPISSRAGRAAKRVLVRARKGARKPMQLLPPFHVHSGENHIQGFADYTEMADAILRSGAALRWGELGNLRT
jgi:tRNA1Val (adenine37-N6)-methyltransferase